MRKPKIGPSRGLPTWVRASRELRFRRRVVKKFYRSAPRQMLVLDAFEARGWPERIENPLPVTVTRNRTRSAQLDTVLSNLNHGLDLAILHFTNEDKGRKIGWHIRASKGK